MTADPTDPNQSMYAAAVQACAACSKAAWAVATANGGKLVAPLFADQRVADALLVACPEHKRFFDGAGNEL